MKGLRVWRVVQYLMWVICFGIFIALIFKPQLGLMGLWDILIPLAPLIIVVVPGIWRNVCPISSVSLISRHVGWSKKKRLSRKSQSRLTTAGLILLLLLIPLRHVIFNQNGLATAALLFLLAATAYICGSIYDWKSAWCAGMCPVHQVERLYGNQGLKPFINAHCEQCHNCSIPCPDSKAISFSAKKQTFSSGTGNTWLLCGGFPGYIWGWFQVADYHGQISLSEVGQAYIFCLGGFLVSLIIFWVLSKVFSGSKSKLLVKGFTALAVSTYYWYRIPALIGFGVHPGDGMLFDMTSVIPSYVPSLIAFAIVVFFFWWFLGRTDREQSWLIRPEYARK